MEPAETGRRYDAIARWWCERHRDSRYGLAQLDRAIAFTEARGRALDAGCGSSGRFIQRMLDEGFETEGVDISAEMIAEARRRHPEVRFELADLAAWSKPGRYRLITAWDSTFHLPPELHEPALANLAGSLVPGGILLFTCGGTDGPGSISGSFAGQDFDYSSLGIPRFLELLATLEMVCVHLEFDQGPGEPHVTVIARRR